jgi:hypothetical protein
MRPGLSFSPDCKRRGINPKWAPTVRDLKAGGVIDCGLEAQGRDIFYARTAHETDGYGVLIGGLSDTSIQLEECPQEHMPGLQHRKRRMTERWVVFDRAADFQASVFAAVRV